VEAVVVVASHSTTFIIYFLAFISVELGRSVFFFFWPGMAV